jgi:hypothetical protein
MNAVAALGGHSNPLQIGEPAAPGFIMGMADVITGYRPLAANFTFFSHDTTPYIVNFV